MPFSKSQLADLIATFAEEVAYFRDAMSRRVPYEFTDEFYLLGIGLAICKARFGGRGGSSEYKVMTAVWRIARAAGTTRPTLPLRRLTNQAGIGSRTTTAKALSRLIEAGWLEIAERTDGLRGNQYWLRIPEEFEDWEEVRKPGPIDSRNGSLRDAEPRGMDVTGDPLADSWLINHDAFAYKALGSTAARLYIHLLAGHLTRRELVALTGLHRDTVKRNLRRLIDNGLVMDDDLHWRALPFSVARLDAIARRHGTAGQREAQARRHEQERQANVMRQLEAVTRDKDVDRRAYDMVDGGTLVNLLTGELPDVYGQFWWLDRLRLGRVAGPVATVRRWVRKLRKAAFADPLSTLVGYVETNLRYRDSSPSGLPRGRGHARAPGPR